MSFKVGQILSENILQSSANDNDKVNFQVQELITTNEVTGNKFKDKRICNISLSSGTTGFVSGQHYYIKLVIKRKFINSDQNITLRLSNDEGENESKNYQYIDDFIIFRRDPDMDPNKYAVYETIISPNASYAQLNVILAREIIDYYTTVNPEGGQWDQSDIENYKGREIEIDVNKTQIYHIKNQISSNSPWIKLGIQGPPGMLMCINGEPIRIGPSGIYEIRNGYKIYFLGFIIKNYDKIVNEDTGEEEICQDSFIIDYQYEEGV